MPSPNLRRRDVLVGAGIAAFAAWGAGGAPRLKPAITDDSGLRVRAARRGLLFGAATSTYQLGQSDFADAFAREAGVLVPEYETKRDALEPVRGHYDFTASDALLAYARAHGMAFRGHTLVWHASNPNWLDDAAFATRDEGLLTDYIAKVMGRYRGRAHSWDVVNEAIWPRDRLKGGLRASPWLKAFGPQYVDIAFHAARAADPGALLVYNDWGCEAGAAENDRFRSLTLEFLAAARRRGVPIDALGLQGHLSAFGAKIDQEKLRTFLGEVRAMGLKILVTEHDVDDSGGPSDTALRDRAVADASRRFLDVMLENPATIAVLTWGLSDRFLETPGLRAMLSGYRPRMLPLDADLARTPLWSAMAEALGRK